MKKERKLRPVDIAVAFVNGECRAYLAAKGGVYERRSYDGVEWTKPALVAARSGVTGVQVFVVRQKIYLLVAAGKLCLYILSDGKCALYPYPVIARFPIQRFKGAYAADGYRLFGARKGKIYQYFSRNCIDWREEKLDIHGLGHTAEGALSPMSGYRFLLYSGDGKSRLAALERDGEGYRAAAERALGEEGMKSAPDGNGKYVIYGLKEGEPFLTEAGAYSEVIGELYRKECAARSRSEEEVFRSDENSASAVDAEEDFSEEEPGREEISASDSPGADIAPDEERPFPEKEGEAADGNDEK